MKKHLSVLSAALLFSASAFAQLLTFTEPVTCDSPTTSYAGHIIGTSNDGLIMDYAGHQILTMDLEAEKIQCYSFLGAELVEKYKCVGYVITVLDGQVYAVGLINDENIESLNLFRINLEEQKVEQLNEFFSSEEGFRKMQEAAAKDYGKVKSSFYFDISPDGRMLAVSRVSSLQVSKKEFMIKREFKVIDASLETIARYGETKSYEFKNYGAYIENSLFTLEVTNDGIAYAVEKIGSTKQAWFLHKIENDQFETLVSSESLKDTDYKNIFKLIYDDNGKATNIIVGNMYTPSINLLSLSGGPAKKLLTKDLSLASAPLSKLGVKIPPGHWEIARIDQVTDGYNVIIAHTVTSTYFNINNYAVIYLDKSLNVKKGTVIPYSRSTGSSLNIIPLLVLDKTEDEYYFCFLEYEVNYKARAAYISGESKKPKLKTNYSPAEREKRFITVIKVSQGEKPLKQRQLETETLDEKFTVIGSHSASVKYNDQNYWVIKCYNGRQVFFGTITLSEIQQMMN